MSFTIYVRMKKPGRKMSRELPPVPFNLDTKPETVRELLLELEIYRQCCGQRGFYEYNKKLYKKVFGSGVIKKPPFQTLLPVLSYAGQVWTVISALVSQYVPDTLKAHFAYA